MIFFSIILRKFCNLAALEWKHAAVETSTLKREDQLEDPRAREVVRDLIKFVWSEHGSGVSSTTATGSQ